MNEDSPFCANTEIVNGVTYHRDSITWAEFDAIPDINRRAMIVRSYLASLGRLGQWKTLKAASPGMTATEVKAAFNGFTEEQVWRQVTNRAHLANVSQSSGSLRNVVWRCMYWTTQASAVTAVKVVFANSYLDATGEHDGLNTIYVTAAVEYDGVTQYFGWSEGSECTIEPGAYAVSRPVTVAIPANTQFFIRHNVRTANASEKYATGYTTRTDWGEGFSSTTPLAQVGRTGTLTGNTSSAMFSPAAVLGLTSTPYQPCAVILGSSSAFGSNETFGSLTDPGDRGYLSRWVTNLHGQVCYAVGSVTAQMWAGTLAGSSRRRALLDVIKPTHAIQQLGSNDIAGGRTVTQIQQDLQVVWEHLNGMGMKVIQTTFTPRTTSTDSWATTTNQTVAASESVRVAINNWIRTRPAPLYKVLEIADLAESARDSGLWSVSGGAYTDDGQHTIRHADIAAAMPALSTMIY